MSKRPNNGRRPRRNPPPLRAGRDQRDQRDRRDRAKSAGRRPPEDPPGRSLLSRLTWFALTAAVWAVLGVAAVVAWYARDLPDIADLEKAGIRKPTVTVLAVDGSVIARYGEIHGEAVRVRDLPPYLPRAFLAIEDRRFYEHPGIDVLGIFRAGLRNLSSGGIREGGSTITQQLAKNLFLTRERTFRRKIQETLLALWLEQRFTKDQILSIYLNRVYFGAGAYGVDAAAHRYFGRGAERLTLFEAAVLAGLVKAPSRDNPIVAPKRAAERANLVLAQMARSGWVNDSVAARARRDEVRFGPDHVDNTSAHYFSDWVLDRVDDYVGYISGDVVIRTTLDPRLQRDAQEAAVRVLNENVKRKVSQAAIVALSPDGAVRAMIGGRDYGDSQYNRAARALRQPGSAFKLFVFLAALESGIHPDDRVSDRPITVQGWSPRNAGTVYRGDVTFREAAARSSNSVAVGLTERVGRNKVVRVARRLGITTPLRADPSLALGTNEVTLLELTGAYAAVANGGDGVWPYGIDEIRDGNGRVLYHRRGDGPGRVIAPEYVAGLNDLFSAVVAWGTGKAARLDRPAAGKTGTNQDNRDAWFVGYTPDLVAGVWLGNDDFSPMKDVSGGSLAAHMWQLFMSDALKGVPPHPLAGKLPDLTQR
jgi:penicillin-binding protein 1A